MEWITVSDRLPGNETTVLVCVPEDDEPVWLGYREDETWYFVEGRVCRPTHWAEVPMPQQAVCT